MPGQWGSDDVIRIRVDIGQAVREFLDQLASQAAEGETRAPANPANRAAFRELAPYRLVEYEYVDESIGGIEGVYLGFPDGSIYAVADDIPEEVVDSLVAGDPRTLPPVYVHVVLTEPRPAAVIDGFLAKLACHVGKGLVGVFRDATGRIGAHSYRCQPDCTCCDGAESSVEALDASMHLSKDAVLERFAARSRGADGRAYARLSFAYAPHLLEFASAAERDDFIRWSEAVCAWVNGQEQSWEDFGFTEILRPAKEAPAGPNAVAVVSPSAYGKGEAWRAFQGGGVSERDLLQVRAYWDYVTGTVASAERG